MIRVIMLLVFLFLVWVLYASGFEKPRKIRISVIALVVFVFAFWLSGYDKRQIRNLVGVNQVESCGVVAKHSYRTNFDLAICIKNKANKGTLSRLGFVVIASQCEGSECRELQRVVRSLLVDIPAGGEATLEQNLGFDNVSPTLPGLSWSIEILETKARRE